MKLKRARSLIGSALLDLLERQNRFFRAIYFPISDCRIGGDAMDYAIGYATLGVLAFAWVYVLAHAFIMDDMWRGK